MCKRDYQYMRIAKLWSENSHAVRHKVGAILVKDNMIISDGYNGTPSGFDNCCEYEVRSLRPEDGEVVELFTKPEVLHAEANAITKVAKSTQSSEGSTLYVTMSPCIECAKLVIQAGIKKVYYDEIYRNTDGLDLLKKAGIELEQIHIE